MTERTYESFAREVRSLLEPTAAGKGYNSTGADGHNPLYELVREVASGDGHALGEIIYKIRRYAAKGNPEDILKAAAWCFLVWRHAATVTITNIETGNYVKPNGSLSPHPPTGPGWQDRVEHGG